VRPFGVPAMPSELPWRFQSSWHALAFLITVIEFLGIPLLSFLIALFRRSSRLLMHRQRQIQSRHIGLA
jgi:hypothetical protein